MIHLLIRLWDSLYLYTSFKPDASVLTSFGTLETIYGADSVARLAVDTLLNLAGLATFAADQKALDDRIAKLIG